MFKYPLIGALGLAFTASLYHLAHTFASVDNNLYMGYVAALAIDLGIITLAYRLKQKRIYWFGIVLFTIISVYGNYIYALDALQWVTPNWLVVLKPIILSATMPILVLYLSEVVSEVVDKTDNSVTLKDKIEQLLDKGVSKTQAAKQLGISRSQLYKELDNG